MTTLPVSVRAAVLRAAGAPFSVETLTMAVPGFGEVRVKLSGTGLCHTDLLIRDTAGAYPLPAVLGHEGSGVVDAVGAGVTRAKPGDHVVLSFASCGSCVPCGANRPCYCANFNALNFGGQRGNGTDSVYRCDHEHVHASFFGQSSFASHALVAERCVVPIERDVPIDIMGPLGCGIQTGAGAVLNVLKPRATDGIAIFGAGSVGLAALLAAKVVGCGTIVAIDLKPARLSLARELGATAVIDARAENAVGRIREMTGGVGISHTLECTGVPAVLRQAVDALAPAGICGVVGAAPFGAEVALDVNHLLAGRTIRGIIEGDSDPVRFIPELVSLWRAGRFPFDRLLRSYPLTAINDAIRDLEAGDAVKPVLRPDWDTTKEL